jgi:hypothetical protein
MSFERYWPEWPPGTKGFTLVLVKAHCAVDALFAHVFGYGSTFQVSLALPSKAGQACWRRKLPSSSDCGIPANARN